MFLGKEIIRPNHSDHLLVRVPPRYPKDLFVNGPSCCDLKASPVPPDVGVSDASRDIVEKRQSISGGLIIRRSSVAKSFSRLQGCLTLSSCEAERVSVCQVAQKCLGLRHLVEYLDSFDDMDELQRFQQEDIAAMKFDQIWSSGVREYYPVSLYSDSQSCIAVLQNHELSRPVRRVGHIP